MSNTLTGIIPTFAAAQAAQKAVGVNDIALITFAAAQAAQKVCATSSNTPSSFAAAQAAQKAEAEAMFQRIVFAAAQAAQKCKKNGWASIEDAGYGKGYVAALNLWRQYIDGLNALRDDKGMTIVQIAHTDIKRFDSPEHDPYDRYTIKLHARAAALVQEHSDIVLFANYRISTVKADVGFNKKVARAVGSGERVLHTSERPAFLAKNRYGLPDTLPLDWPAFAQAMPEAIRPLLMPTAATTQTV